MRFRALENNTLLKYKELLKDDTIKKGDYYRLKLYPSKWIPVESSYIGWKVEFIIGVKVRRKINEPKSNRA